MYIAIAGGGKVGRSIAVDLLSDGHDVTIIEKIEGPLRGVAPRS